MIELPDAVTPEDLAKRLGFSSRRVRRLARDLGACRILGNRMVLLQQDVNVILEALKPHARTKPASHTFRSMALPKGDYESLRKLLQEREISSKK